MRRQIDVPIVCVFLCLGLNEHVIAGQPTKRHPPALTENAVKHPLNNVSKAEFSVSYEEHPISTAPPSVSNEQFPTLRDIGTVQDHSDQEFPEAELRSPNGEFWLEAMAAMANEEKSRQYLPPRLAEPDRPAGAAAWEGDIRVSQQNISPGPSVHPAARGDLSGVCPAPPDPSWLSALKAQWALDGYGNAEPLPGQRSYLPFPCY